MRHSFLQTHDFCWFPIILLGSCPGHRIGTVACAVLAGRVAQAFYPEWNEGQPVEKPVSTATLGCVPFLSAAKTAQPRVAVLRKPIPPRLFPQPVQPVGSCCRRVARALLLDLRAPPTSQS